MDKKEKDLETRLIEVSDKIASAQIMLEEIPIEQWNEQEKALDDTLKEMKSISRQVDYILWLIDNPEEETELS
jgi:hypothetical protein